MVILSQVPASRRQGTIFHEGEGSTGSQGSTAQNRACRWSAGILADEDPRLADKNPHTSTLSSPVCRSGPPADIFVTPAPRPPRQHASPHDSRAPEGCWPTSRELCASTRAHGRTRTHCRPPSTAPPTIAGLPTFEGLRKMSPAHHQQRCGDLTESLVTIFVTPRSGSMHVQRSTCVVKNHPHRSRAFECVPLQDCCLPDRSADPDRHREGIGTRVLRR